MGEGPIEFRDMVAWQAVTGIELMPWEARLLRRLSSEYLTEKSKARKHDRLAPYQGTRDDIASNRDQVAASVRALFGRPKKN